MAATIFSDALNFPVPVTVTEMLIMALDPADYSNIITITTNDSIDINDGISDGQPFKLILIGSGAGGIITWGVNVLAPTLTLTVVSGKTYVCDFYFINSIWYLANYPTPL